jgi:hypothetical protein
MKTPLRDISLPAQIIASREVRKRLCGKVRGIGGICGHIDPGDQLGRSVPHLCLNEAAYFRRLGASYPIGATRSSYFDVCRAYLAMLREVRSLCGVKIPAS